MPHRILPTRTKEMHHARRDPTCPRIVFLSYPNRVELRWLLIKPLDQQHSRDMKKNIKDEEVTDGDHSGGDGRRLHRVRKRST